MLNYSVQQVGMFSFIFHYRQQSILGSQMLTFEYYVKQKTKLIKISLCVARGRDFFPQILIITT